MQNVAGPSQCIKSQNSGRPPGRDACRYSNVLFEYLSQLRTNKQLNFGNGPLHHPEQWCGRSHQGNTQILGTPKLREPTNGGTTQIEGTPKSRDHPNRGNPQSEGTSKLRELPNAGNAAKFHTNWLHFRPTTHNLTHNYESKIDRTKLSISPVHS